MGKPSKYLDHKALVVYTIIGALLIAGLLIAFSSKDAWVIFIDIAVATFILSLIILDYITVHLTEIRKVDGLTSIKTTLGDETFKKLIDELPPADKAELISANFPGVLNSHEIRRAITFTLTVIFAILIFYSASQDAKLFIKDNPIIELFTTAYLVIISFYFGTRTVEAVLAARKKQTKNEKKNSTSQEK